jgi:cobalt transporter subunit CbtB
MLSTPHLSPSAPASSATHPALGAALGAAAVGIVLIYLAGFSQLEAIHDGAHDARHAAALPCH